MSYVTEHFEADKTPDLVFIPIGLNYDRIAEDENMVRYSSKQFRAMGHWYVLRQGMHFAARVCWELLRGKRRFGYVCAHFGRPVSFTSWLGAQNADWPQLTRKERFEHVQKLGGRLMQDISDLVPATPVPVLCRVWFDEPTLALDTEALQDAFAQLCTKLRQAGCYVFLIEDDEAATFAYALEATMERGIIEQDADGRYRVTTGKEALVRYSGNSLSQFFPEGGQA